MPRSTRVLSTAGAAKTHELASAMHDKNEVLMLGEVLVFGCLLKVRSEVDVRTYG